MGSMAEEPSGAVAAPQVEVVEPEQLEAWTTEGQNLLDRYKLKEAEQLFHKVLIHTDQKAKDRDKNVIISLVGLSEIYSKRARSMRNNELEWHRMYMHAISSKRKAMECCVNALDDGQEEDVRWFRSQEHRARANLKVLQDCLVRSLQERIVEDKSGLTPMEKLMGLRKRVLSDIEEQAEKAKPLVNTSWLENFQGYVSEKFKVKEPQEEPEDNFDDMPNLKRSQSIESLQEVKPIRKKKINFEKVQAAIQDLVKQITTDMRHRQIHKDMTPEEKLTLMSPLADNFDLLGTFRNALYSEDSPGDIAEETDEEVRKDDASSSSDTMSSSQERLSQQGLDETKLTSIKSEDGTGGSEVLLAAANWRHSQDNLNYKILSGASRRWQSSSQKSRSSTTNIVRQNSTELATASLQNSTLEHRPSYRSPTPNRYSRSQSHPPVEEDDALKDVGVLRVWRGYKRENSPDPSHHSQYKLQTYEELSPLTEVAGRAWAANARRRNQKVQEEQDLSVLPEAPVSERELKLTLALALTTLADRLRKNKSLKESTDLYIYALGILQNNSAANDEDGSALKPHIAHIMQSLGTIKCNQGDFVGGSQLMEECINIYGMIKNKNADISMANTWYQLGSAFMAEQWKESTLYEYIMKAVKEVMEKEIKSEADTPDIAEGDDESDDDEDSEGDSYWVSTQEAIGCFNHALDIIRKLGQSDEHNQLFVDALTKLGDCNIMTGNYEHAIKCYEEALYMFKNIIGSTTLPNNAHVLSMLGTTNFLCGNYSKAASMYECAHMLQQHIYGADDATFEMAFTLTMMGLTFYSMKRFHRSIAWCLKAFELYTLLYKEEITNIDKLHRWFVTESLYVVGFSYGTLSFHEKALNYLGISKCMVKGCEDVDVKQCVKILKAMADEYSTLEDNATALAYYEEALQLSQALGNESSAAALQNQLLNRMAGVHVNTKEYTTAALYLQQALDYQKNVENTIKDDLIGILRQLGLTYTLSGDVDKAIECYNDCLDAYQETPGTNKEEKAQLMGTLGTLYHVKACIQDDNDDMENLLTRAEKFYQDAMNIDSTSSVCVQYANYLYQQAQAGDALLAMLPVVHSPSSEQRNDQSVVYNGVEQAVLPEHLQQEIDEMDEVTLETQVFSKFLAILCYKQLKLDKDAEDCLVDLYKAVCPSDVALNHSILGYAMLEMNLYPEAAECFANAAGLQHDNDLAITNYWISLCLWSYGTMTSSIRNIFADALREAEDEWVLENKLREAVRKANQKPAQGVRDSGYYDHTLESGEDHTDEAWAPMEEIAYISDHLTESDRTWDGGMDRSDARQLLERLMARRRQQEEESDDITPMYGEASEAFVDRGYTSNESLVDRRDLPPVAERIDKWESIRNVYEYDNPVETTQAETSTWKTEECETPAVILEMLRQQQELLNREYQVHFDVGIIGEEDEEGDGNKPSAETNTTFANMVETPQSILHELERKMVEEEQQQARMNTSYRNEEILHQGKGTSGANNITYEDKSKSDSYGEEWVTTEEVVYHNQETEQRQSTQHRKREHSPEPDDYEETWVTEEVVVETPAAILQALQQGSYQQEHTISNSTGHNETTAISSSSSRQIMPMELSPDTELTPETTETWTVEETVETPAAILQSLRHDQHHYDVIDSIHNWDSEGNHVTGETWTKGQQSMEDFRGDNNNRSLYHMNGGGGGNERTQTHHQQEQTTRTTQHHPSQFRSWRETETKPTYYTEERTITTPVTTSHDVERWGRSDRWSDGQNGNGWSSGKTAMYDAASTRTTSEIHESYVPQQEEPEETPEVWETSEETVMETPPEILALLRAQQMQ